VQNALEPDKDLVPAVAPAAAPAPATTEYKPITTPPDGLLATAVGSPWDPRPPIDPATYENDDVVDQMNRITSTDSDYMKLARTAGLQTANKRGLLNSSIASGASEAEALKAAAPLAGQNASQMAQRNLARIQGYFDKEKQQAQFGHETEMQATELSSVEQRAADEIKARLDMQGIDIGAQAELQNKALAHARELADLNIAADSERLGRQLTSAEKIQHEQLASNEALAQLDRDLKESQFSRELTSREDTTRFQEEQQNLRANLDAATRVQMQAADILSEQDKSALAAYIATTQMYATNMDNLWGNKDLPAPARDAAMKSLNELYNSTLNLPALTFGRQLAWSGGQPTGGTGGTGLLGVPPPPPSGQGAYGDAGWTGPSYEEILAMDNDGIKGNYNSNRTTYNAWAQANGRPLLPPEKK